MIANIFQAFFSFKRNLKWFSFNPAQNFQSSIKANHIFPYMKKKVINVVESRDNCYWEFAYRKWFFFLKKSNIWYYTHLSTSEERPMVDVCKLRKIGKGFFYRDTFLPFFLLSVWMIYVCISKIVVEMYYSGLRQWKAEQHACLNLFSFFCWQKCLMYDNMSTNKKLWRIYSLSRTNWFSLPHGLCVVKPRMRVQAFTNILCVFRISSVFSMVFGKVNIQCQNNINFEHSK